MRMTHEEIEAAVADSKADMMLEDVGKLPRTSDYRNAYRAAKETEPNAE